MIEYNLQLYFVDIGHNRIRLVNLAQVRNVIFVRGGSCYVTWAGQTLEGSEELLPDEEGKRLCAYIAQFSHTPTYDPDYTHKDEDMVQR